MEPDFWKDVTIAMDKNCLEHVGQHVLDLVSVLLVLLASEKSEESLLLFLDYPLRRLNVSQNYRGDPKTGCVWFSNG